MFLWHWIIFNRSSCFICIPALSCNKTFIEMWRCRVYPGPKDKHCLSICHYNINSIAAHNFAKLSSLEAFNAVHNFDVICISESYLDSSFSSDDSALALKGYKLVRADHPLDIKRGGTCIYYKEILPIKFLNVISLPECLLCEISYNNQKCFISSLYRSPSQSANEFQVFLKELESIIESICSPGNSDLVIIIGDFKHLETR